MTEGSGRAAGSITRSFVFAAAPFPEAHASSLAATPSGLVAAWFGGTREKAPDVGIWCARHLGASWSEPVEVALGRDEAGARVPCWNPVLHRHSDGRLMLFWKAGPNPRAWWGMLACSPDDGASWQEPRRLPAEVYGPIRAKPLELAGGDLLCPSSCERFGWRSHTELYRVADDRWQRLARIGGLLAPPANQPTLLRHGPRLQALLRSKRKRILTSWSADQGRSWSRLRATGLPNPNSGIDALTLADGRHLLVYNHSQRGRSPLDLALSMDGLRWRHVAVLEDLPGEEFSYPAIIQASDGTVHITYTWKRRLIAHRSLDPASLPEAA